MEQILHKVLEIRIPAEVRYVSLVRRGVRSLAESVGFGREDVADMMVAVSEAVTNSVKHGSAAPEQAEVLVKCQASRVCLEVVVEDQSDLASPPECPAACEPTAESGRGVMMMRALTDECEPSLTDQGLRIRMAKQLEPANSDE